MGKFNVMSLERLIGEHDDIDVFSRNLQMLTRQTPPDFKKTGMVLAQLKRDVTAHLEYEYRTVYSVLIERYSTVPLAGADRFERLFRELEGSWANYFAACDKCQVHEDWGGFCRATAEVIPHVRACMQKEINLVYSLALSDGTIKLRDPL